MANEAAAVELRCTLSAFIEARVGPASTREIVAAFHVAHPGEVEAAASTLRDLALTKLVDEVSRRRKVGDPTQGDLFGRMSFPNGIVVYVEKAGRLTPMRKPFLGATLTEATTYLERAVPERKRRRDEGAKAILDRIRPYMSTADMTVSDGLAAAAAAERGSA